MVKQITKDEGMPKGSRLRVKVIGGGCAGFSYDINFDTVILSGKEQIAVVEDYVKLRDRLIHTEGVYLVVDEMSLMYLVGVQIDYVDSLSGAGFKFENPNTKSTCGCGSSFTV